MAEPLGIPGNASELARLELAKESLHSFGELRISALGASMVPSIYPGDVLTVRRENGLDVRCGDVVLTSRGNRFFAHRVAGKSQSSEGVRVITCGDALLRSDPAVAEQEILGRVICVERGTRKFGVRPRLNWLERTIQWVVRRSDIAMKIMLHAHLVRQSRTIVAQPTAKAN